jgi:PiT family inorganic phosphate transporter
MLIALFLATCFLAYSNGANDNFKGVASLYGCRAASYRTAITWATITTFAGSIASIFLAQALLKRFSGKGLVPDTVAGSETFLLAVALIPDFHDSWFDGGDCRLRAGRRRP